MLSSATCRRRNRRPAAPRRLPVELSQPYLNFLDLPVPEACLWEQLTDQQKTAVIAALARLMVRAAAPANNSQENQRD
jgi:hypothetical protein